MAKLRNILKELLILNKEQKELNGNEEEFCLLLSKEAKSISLPMLLCTEEDVEGNHSSASGRIDEKILFYLMSRGFSYIDAMKIMVKARFNKIIDNFENETKEKIIEKIDCILK